MKLEILDQYGFHYEKGLARCMGDAELYEMLLNLFLESDTLQRAQSAWESADYSALFACMHELKGACGNAEMTELYGAVCPLVEYLRKGGRDNAEIAPLFARVTAAYERAREGIFRASQA